MALPRPGFLTEVVSAINGQLNYADAWSALKAEHDTWATNGVVLVQADIDTLGMPGLTLQQFTDALASQQALIDSIHVAATAAKLYRLKR